MSKKKLLAIILSLVMVLSLVPAQVFAESGEPAAEPEQVTASPAFEATKSAGDLKVYISAAEGVFPEGTTVEVREVTGQELAGVKEAVEAGLKNSVKKIQAVDITFWANGVEIQPEGAVNVQFSSGKIAEFVSPVVVHVPDAGKGAPEAVKSVRIDSKQTMSFKASSFSVYAVVEPQSEDTRLTVNFVNGSNKVSILVKEADATDTDDQKFADVVYDPSGEMGVAAGETFLGWTKTQNYAVDVTPMTIEEVRSDIKTQLPPTAAGQEVTYYAVVIKSYKVSYVDEQGITLGVDELKFVASEGTHTFDDYTVQMSYTPDDTHNFEGWKVKTGTVTPAQDVYANGTTVTITGDVVFEVVAPKGNWLVFDENGKGAKYNAPKFIKTGEVTEKPIPDSEMTRYGYTFDGWYTDAACTTAFEFGKTISERTVIYAKWIPAETAKYSVIIWRQAVSGEGYDFEEVINLSGNVGTTINTVSASGTGDARYATINSTAYRWTGFHLDTYDTDVEITPEGTAIVNVYYNRNEITLNFYTYSNRQWTVRESMTGLYGSTLADNNYTWPNDLDWYENGGNGGSVSGTRTTFLDAFLPSDGASTVNFYGRSHTGNATIVFYKQNPEKTGYVEANTVTAAGDSRFYISDKYNGFEAYQYRVGNGSWTSVGNKDASSGYYNNGQPVNYSNRLEIRFNRIEYPLSFLNGIYVKGDKPENGQEYEVSNHGALADTVQVTFGADLTSYNEDGDDYFVPTAPDGYENYVFAGWYADEECSTPYSFTTMTEGGVTVYAKWIIKQYRVFLHPGVPADEALDWGSENQDMNFRITDGGKVSLPTGIREGYELVGWYTDEAYTKLFDKDTVLNSSTVTTKYDKTKDFTDPMDKWGNGATTNSDATGYNGGDRFWIEYKLDLYARWRATIDGAKGIGVVYDAAEGTNPPTDEELYVDQAEATAGVASTAPEGYRFDHWVVQTWNGTSGKYEDTETTVFPGSTYQVLKANAKALVTEWVNPQDSDDVLTVSDPEPGTTAPDSTHTKIKTATYTIQLKAVYVELGEEVPTSISWYDNYSDENEGKGKLYRADEDLSINEAVDIYAAPTREGYEFLGWTKTKGGTEADFLKWDKENSKYTANINGTDYDVTQVAADEKTPLEDLFAVWKVSEFGYTIHHYLLGTTTKVADDETDVADFGTEVTAAAATTFLAAYDDVTLSKDSTDPESGKITIGSDADENVIIVYYTIAITIEASTDSKKYDGTALEGEYTITGALEADVETIEKALGDAPTATDVADSTEYLTEDEQAAITLPGYYTVEYTSGKLTIEPREVTLTSADDEKEYDGKALTNDEVTEGGDGFADGEGAEYDVTGTQTLVGESDNEFTYTLKSGTKADNYKITTEFGTLKVTDRTEKFEIELTAKSDSAKYDGKEHTVEGFEGFEKGEALEFEFDGVKFTVTNIEAKVSGTDAGTYPNVAASPAASGSAAAPASVIGRLGSVLRGAIAKKAADTKAAANPIVKDADGNDVSDQFDVTVKEGKLEISKRSVTLTSADDEKTYDGEPLTNDKITEGGDGFVSGEGADYTVTGTQTDAGSSENAFTYALKSGTKAGNYDITTETGTLTVNPVTDKVTVTITENSGSEKYDGKEKKVTGYTTEIDNDLYTEDDFEFSGDDTVKGIDAGTYDMELKAGDFKNTNENFTNVEFKIVDGQLEITKRKVTLTSGDAEKKFDGDPLTNDKITEGGDGWADGEGAEYDVTGKQTEVGESDNEFTYKLKDGTKADNYEITTEFGKLKVTEGVPDTGDYSQPAIWGAAFAASVICMLYLAFARRKREKHYSR